MKKIIFKMLVSILLLLVIMPVTAQTVEKEKSIEISRRAKRGYLEVFEYDEDTKTYFLMFVIGENAKAITYEIYRFSYDFDLLEQFTEKEAFEKFKGKYKELKNKRKPNRDDVVKDYYLAKGNLMMKLILERTREITKWNWVFGTYRTKTETLEKVKPKNADGDNLTYFSHYYDAENGDIIVLVAPRTSEAGKQYSLMRFDQNLDFVKKTDITFEYSMTPIYTYGMSNNTFVGRFTASAAKRGKTLNDKDISSEGTNTATGVIKSNGAFFIFAPAAFGGSAKKYNNPDKNAYEIVYSDAAMNVSRVPFKSPNPYWRVDDVARSEDGKEWYFYGVSAEGKDKYYNQMTNPAMKFNAVQLMKYTIGQKNIEFINSTNLDEMSTKLVVPPSQKKKPEYEGKKFATRGYLTTNGEFFIYGQNIKIKDVKNVGKVTYYLDAIGFYYNDQGKLKAQYGIDALEDGKESKMLGAEQAILTYGEKLYWIITEVDDIEDGIPLAYPRIGTIDRKTANLSNFKILGLVDKRTHYLDINNPMIPLETDKLTFFGSTKNGKYLYFGRVKFD
ncbi:MAG: hypothetical protein H7Y04_12485 [Verrucomicrobia bacterium]|nr:hypothetical protein [Cytophagales bacterium]